MARHTVSYLTRLFEEIGLSPDSRHGQNFLVDINLVELLVRTADIGSHDVVLEVGTGTGSLTAMLAKQAAAVVTVEIDQHLYQLARQELADFENVTMLHQDALRNKNNLHPNVIQAVQEQLALDPQRHFKVAANLPYNIATPVISNLLLSEIVPETMTVTIQKELADRITAKPSTKDYSALSIWVQSLCDVEIIRVMSPSVFWPRPKVQSAIIHIIHRPKRREQIPDLDFFHSFVRAMFFHRRKFLRSVVLSAFKGKLDKPAVDEILAEMQLGPDSRAEQLDVPTMLALYELLRRRLES
jgi:16S rRNA (adenine1518-N6/adenine1519-N6)-dimethyltransferase